MTKKAYILALHIIEGLGPIRLKKVLDYFKDPKLAWETDIKEFRVLGIPNPVLDKIKEAKKSFNPEVFLDNLKKDNINVYTIFDQEYPELLKQIYDPPIVLYIKGQITKADKKAIGIVGTRKMTGYGKIVTEKFANELAEQSITIVSGLARGVDTLAHRCAIASGGRTIAVLGGGLNKIFPPENKGLADKIASQFGAVISEYPPDYPALAGNFPSRNRIISGLSKGVLVTEATLDSGSLITAKSALEQNREVFAVPGQISSPYCLGPLKLIQQGAKLVIDVEDILEELGLNKIQTKNINPSQVEGLSILEKLIIESLEDEALHIDDIIRLTKTPSALLSANLIKLEISGFIKSLGGGIYSKNF